MEKLNLNEACVLYDVIGKYLPDDYETILDFSKKLLDNLVEQEQQEIYIWMIAFMIKEEVDTVLQRDPQELYETYLRLIMFNQIHELSILKDVGYGR